MVGVGVPRWRGLWVHPSRLGWGGPARGCGRWRGAQGEARGGKGEGGGVARWAGERRAVRVARPECEEPSLHVCCSPTRQSLPASPSKPLCEPKQAETAATRPGQHADDDAEAASYRSAGSSDGEYWSRPATAPCRYAPAPRDSSAARAGPSAGPLVGACPKACLARPCRRVPNAQCREWRVSWRVTAARRGVRSPSASGGRGGGHAGAPPPCRGVRCAVT